MLRHTVFALLLIGAAFAGGAAINGPGLIWLQRTVLGGPSIIVVDKPSGEQASASVKPKQFPTAKAAPLEVELPKASSPEPKEKKAEAVVEAEPASPLELPATPTPAPAPEPVLARPAELPSPDLGPSPSPTLADQSPIDPGTVPKSDAVARLASTGSPASAPSTSNWSEIREKMRILGITRYSLEAETDGQVRFSCVIPVEGLRAVSQQFEAEGDDEFQAAEAALRRVVLWKATEAK